MTKKQELLLGAHISINGGLEKAIIAGELIGCTTIQIFTKSNRQWFARPLLSKDILLFKKTKIKSSIKSIIAHASYLINLGSPNKEIEQKSIKALKIELERCNTLDIPFLILHPGSHLKTDEKTCITQISSNLDQVLVSVPGTTKILLETMAGQGTSVGYTFKQITEIRKQSIFKKRIGVCFDTCHAFAAGYDFRTKKTYENMWQEFDKTIGLKHLKVIHINDSKKGLGSNVDRHEHIGKGKLKFNTFRLLFNDSRFFNIPKILETPKKSIEEDLKNMETIKKLISIQTRKKLLFHKNED